MIYSTIKKLLVVALLGIGAWIHSVEGIGTAWYLYAAALILLATQLLFGNVWVAFGELKKGNAVQAELLINKNRFPQLLLKGHRAYYHFVKGMVSLNRKDLEEGQLHLESAANLGMRTTTDNALVCLNIAHIQFLKERPAQAQQWLKRARSFDTNDLMIKENIAKMEQALQ